MNTAQRLLLISVLGAALALPARAYNDQVTHPQLTIIATEKSVLYQDGTIMLALGLFPAAQQNFIYGARAGETRYGRALYPLSAFVGEGAFDEDVYPRSLHHFYDPFNNAGLNIGGVSILGSRRSYEWALEELGAPIEGQHRSEWDARAFLRRGLTFNEGTPAESDFARRVALAEMFLSLGHVMHHIQDMAQPQHVRNDLHWDQYPYFFNPLYDPSRYEAYTAERGPFVEVIAESAAPNFPGASEMKRPRDFWTNGSGSGIAQYVNRNFVSKDTNFELSGGVVVGDYPLPTPGLPVLYTLEALYSTAGVPVPAQIQTLCGTPAINCTMSMYPTAVSAKASTLSLFDQDLRPQNSRLFSLNRFNFDDAHPVLIQRAVSYSAGFLNYFFRGKFEVMAPASGPYAVVDHSLNQGFTQLRVRVRNTSGEALAPGQLRAIANFHRNGCYTPDLRGEFTIQNGVLIPPQCPPGVGPRSPEAHLRMTPEETHGFAAGETKEMTFHFADPIPLNATDLKLTILYRGMVGEEVDGFALGAVDLSEPTYYTIMNATDVFELNGEAFYDYDEIIANIGVFPYSIIDKNNPPDGVFTVPPDVDVRGGNILYEISVNGMRVGEIPALPEGRFSRIALLVSPFGAQVTLRALGNGFNLLNSYNFPAKLLQYHPELGGTVISPVDALRNQFFQFASVSYYHFYPTTGTPLELMPESNAPNAEVLVPVTMVDQGAALRDESTLMLRQETAAGARGNAAREKSREKLVMRGGPEKLEKPDKPEK